MPVDLEVLDERHRLPIDRPYVTAAIGVVGLVVTLVFNLFGDGLRDAFDPRAH
jgi:ABC-type dipeptide/oligopeptide/nickel transport system permease subunit